MDLLSLPSLFPLSPYSGAVYTIAKPVVRQCIIIISQLQATEIITDPSDTDVFLHTRVERIMGYEEAILFPSISQLFCGNLEWLCKNTF